MSLLEQTGHQPADKTGWNRSKMTHSSHALSFIRMAGIRLVQEAFYYADSLIRLYVVQDSAEAMAFLRNEVIFGAVLNQQNVHDLIRSSGVFHLSGKCGRKTRTILF